MPRKNINLTPSTVKMLEKMGTQIKRARLRRNISVEVIADQAGISETSTSIWQQMYVDIHR